MSESLDAIGGRKSIDILPENLSVGRELTRADAVSQIGEKTGQGDKQIKDTYPMLKDFKGKVHFENIRDKQGKTIGVFVIGTEYGEEIFRYKILYIDGKYVKSDN